MSKLFTKNSFAGAEEKFFQLKDLLSSAQAKRMRLSEVESMIKDDGRELLRLLLQGYVDEHGLCDIGDFIVGSDGVVRNHKRIREREIKTLFGYIKIKRVGYGAHGKDSLFPKDGLLNLPQNSYSFGIQRQIVEEAIRGSFEEGIESIKRMLGIIVPKRQAEKIVLLAARHFEAFYELQLELNAKKLEEQQALPLLILTVDGKGIAMKKECLRDETRKRAENNSHKLTTRLSPGEKPDSKRIAVVASVYLVERFVRTPEEIVEELFESRTHTKRKRPRPKKKRVWASLEHSFKTVISEMFKEAHSYDPAHEKEWIALVDGDKKQRLYLLQEAKRYGVKITIICDFIHVLEYLWKAGHSFFKVPSDLEKWVSVRLLRVLQGKSGLTAAFIIRSATNKGLTQREAIDRSATYLLNLSSFFNIITI